MKHVSNFSKRLPAKALWPENHPDFEDAIKGFFEDPIGVIELHLDKEEEG